MKNALITGITGQDGSYLAELLLNKGYHVYGLVTMSSADNLFRIKHLLSNENFKILYGDMTDEASLFKAVQDSNPDEIYNLAAQSHVGLSSMFSEYTTQVNAIGILKLINVIKSLKIDNKVKLYHALTADIFGDSDEEKLNENSDIKPLTPYACAKAYSLWLTRSFRKQGMFIVNGIAFSHESPRRPDKFVTRKITKAAVRIKYGKQDKLELGNISVRRDWGHAKEYVEAMYLAMQKDISDDYVFATGITTSLREFCLKAFKELGIELEFKGSGLDEKAYDKVTGKLIIEINPVYSRKFEKINHYGDYSKAKKLLGWNPKITIDEIIKEMIQEDLKEEAEKSNLIF